MMAMAWNFLFGTGVTIWKIDPVDSQMYSVVCRDAIPETYQEETTHGNFFLWYNPLEYNPRVFNETVSQLTGIQVFGIAFIGTRLPEQDFRQQCLNVPMLPEKFRLKRLERPCIQ